MIGGLSRGGGRGDVYGPWTRVAKCVDGHAFDATRRVVIGTNHQRAHVRRITLRYRLSLREAPFGALFLHDSPFCGTRVSARRDDDGCVGGEGIILKFG